MSAPDNQALLATCNGEIAALLICLSSIHEENEGCWFIEWASHEDLASREIFASLDAAADWLDRRLQAIVKLGHAPSPPPCLAKPAAAR